MGEVSETKEWPVYFAENVILGNEKSSVGVATLWTPKEAFAKKLNPDTFRLVGQLYSNDGINPMIRNVLANPTIRTIILCGQDKIGSADSLALLLQNGINEKGEVIGKEESKIEKEIPHEAVERFRANVEVIDMRGVLKPDEIQAAIDNVEQNADAWAEPEFFPEPDLSADWYPSEPSVYTARGATVADVWPKILQQILRYGEEKMTNHSSGSQYELLNMCAVITDEDPDDIAWADYFPFTREHYEGYKPQVLTPEPVPSLSYTYGMRIRNNAGVNQVESMIAKLKETPHSRQAIASLWQVEVDDQSDHPPCLDLVQALVKYDKLHLTCYLRSNDMFRAWPENALAFRAMQKEIAEAVGVEMGSLTTISASAHIYDDTVPQAKEIVEEYYPKLPCEQDPRGNYVIKVVAGKHIEVIHMTPEGRKVGKYEGKKAMAIFNDIALNGGTSVHVHSFDLGAELQKAQIALEYGLEYTQDRPLPLKDALK